MHAEKNKKVVSLTLCLVISLMSFSLGIGFGKNTSDSKSTIANIENKEDEAVKSADFAAFWEAWKVLDEKYVTTASTTSSQEKIWGAIKGLASSYNDPYTVFFPPVENKAFEEGIQGNFQGVGMEIGIKDEILTVVSPLKGTPAYKAGIKPGDKILQIDGVVTTNMTVETAVSKIRGEKGTKVKLNLYRDEETGPFEIEVVRDVIEFPVVETEFSKQDKDVFIIRLFSFSAPSTNAFRGALREFVLSNRTKLVLDLRGNPGGFLDASIDMASWFLPQGKVVVTEDFGSNKPSVIHRSISGRHIFNDKLKMVILVNGGSASASEILAGALQEHKVAKLVGTQTYGKGSVQELVPLPGDTSLKVTVARWLTPNGTSISEGGLTPDHIVKITSEDFENEKDPQLDKAIEILNQ